MKAKTRRRSLRLWGALVIALLTGSSGWLAQPSPAMADDMPVFTDAGVCRFSPLLVTDNLVATYGPSLISVTGHGTCTGTGGLSNTINLQLSGGSGLTCRDGLENLSGWAVWSNGIPGAQPSLFASAVGVGPNLHLVIQGFQFIADADLTWANKNAAMDCLSSGGFTADLTGEMVFEVQ